MDGKEHEPEPWRHYPYGEQAPASTDANDGTPPGHPDPLPRRPTEIVGTANPYGHPPPNGQSVGQGSSSYSSLQFDTMPPPAEPSGTVAPGPYPSQFEYGPGMASWNAYGTGRYDTTDRVDPGALTYGDLLYAQGRHASQDATTETAAPSGPRHAHTGSSVHGPSTDRTSTTGGYAALGALRSRRRRAADPTEDEEQRRHMPLWQELPLLLVVAFCLAVLIRSFLLQAFFIPSSSMEQTLLIGDRVLVNKVIYDLREPHRGEVVVFRGTNDWAPENYSAPATGVFSRIGRTLGDLVGVSQPGEKDFIKRVIGLPGDHVQCCDGEGRVMVNGVGVDEPYIYANSSLDVPPSPHTCGSRRFDEVVVPPGQLWVMGDHRAVSQDSRCQGPVPIENVIGRAFVIVWPSGRWDTLDVPNTFDGVPVALSPSGSVSAVPVEKNGMDQGAAIVTLPILVTLVGTARTGRRRRWRPRTLRR